MDYFCTAVLSCNARWFGGCPSGEHFSVDSTLIEAWVSTTSFRPKDGGGDDETHVSRTDGDARLYRKGDGQSGRLCFMGHLLMENANALIVDAALTRASRHRRAGGGAGHAGASRDKAADHPRRRQGL